VKKSEGEKKEDGEVKRNGQAGSGQSSIETDVKRKKVIWIHRCRYDSAVIQSPHVNTKSKT
jgi:hypothetical protein